jgi:hypothetical protein
MNRHATRSAIAASVERPFAGEMHDVDRAIRSFGKTDSTLSRNNFCLERSSLRVEPWIGIALLA